MGQDQGKKTNIGTNINYYITFLLSLMDELDAFPQIKDFYLVMGNTLIHISEKIEKSFKSRGYQSVYLLIEQSWSVAKSKVKRNNFRKKNYE